MWLSYDGHLALLLRGSEGQEVLLQDKEQQASPPKPHLVQFRYPKHGQGSWGLAAAAQAPPGLETIWITALYQPSEQCLTHSEAVKEWMSE